LNAFAAGWRSRLRFGFSWIVCLIPMLASSPTADTQPRGRVRTYFIAADEIDWDYAPSHTDLTTGDKFHFQDVPDSKGMLDPNATAYRKVVFREYTDKTFWTLKPRAEDWIHLGILGPLIRAEVGDTIRVVFKNNATRPYSIHPHGVSYKKDSEGAGYEDGTSGKDRADDAIAPGALYTYTWDVPERAGPAEHDGSTAFWVYHSHVDEGKDINSGLIGPLLITRRGMARPDASPTDVDREFVTQFGLFDEHLRWYWDFNLKRLYGDAKNYDGSDKKIHDFHHWFSINGYEYGNGPMLTMHRGQRVRWYLFANPNEEEQWDIHTAHWHGQTVVIGHMRNDMAMLNPMTSVVADMVPDNPGIWLLHCHMPGHAVGMRTRFQVVPK
jgi:FtsP/CotA-like multicopper oxidase with cupredoxin domain